jgi:hypothetical protein
MQLFLDSYEAEKMGSSLTEGVGSSESEAAINGLALAIYAGLAIAIPRPLDFEASAFGGGSLVVLRCRPRRRWRPKSALGGRPSLPRLRRSDLDLGQFDLFVASIVRLTFTPC